MAVEVLVDDRWLRGIGPVGDLSWVTRWPGGLFQVAWTMSIPEGRRVPGLEPGALVQLRDGALSLGWAQLTEPDWAASDIPGFLTATFNAKGLSEQAAQFLCLASDGHGTSVANDAIDTAISFGGWDVIRDTDFSSTPLTGDAATTQSSPLPSLLDGVVQALGQNWGIDPDRRIFRAANRTDVSWHVIPGQVDLGVADDNFATDLYVDYISSTTSAGAVRHVANAEAFALYGRRKMAIVDAIGLGPMTVAQADAIGNGIFAQARLTMGWTNPLVLNSSQILDAGGNPASLDRVAARQLVRVHGVFDARVRSPYTDVVIGECTRARGADTVTISPMGAVGRTMQDVIEGILKAAAAKKFKA